MNATILDEWWGTGRLRALHPIETVYDNRFLEKWITHQEAVYRKQLPDGVPALHLPAAVWALIQFYRASQLLVFRELGNEFVETGLEIKPSHFDESIPNVTAASVHYSVDLSFRFLPDLHRFAKLAGADDLLVKFIEQWCDYWPLSGARLSSLALSDDNHVRLEPIRSSRCLSLLYSERQKNH